MVGRPSGEARDCVITVDHAVVTVLVVDGLILVVCVVVVVDDTINDRLSKVDEKEHGHHGEDETSPVARDALIDDAVALY